MSEAQAANLVPPPPDPRLATLAREIETLEKAMHTGRWVRIGLVVVIVAFTLGMAWRFVALSNKLQSEENIAELMKAGRKRFEEQMPLIRKQLQLLVDETSPAVTQAFYAQAKADMPQFMAAMRAQREPMVENLKTKLTERLNSGYSKVASEQEDLIRENIPEAADPKVLAKIEEQLNKMFARLVQKYYIDQLEGQMAVMFQTWDEFPAEEHGPTDPPLPDILIGHLLEVASAKMASTDVQPLRPSVEAETEASAAEPESAQPDKTPEKSSSLEQPETAPRVAAARSDNKTEPVPPEPIEEQLSAE